MVREFFADLKNQKLRTSLTVLGIAWGTVAVVVLLAFGVGLEKQTKKRFHGLGDRIVILFGGRTTKAFAGFPDGRQVRLTAADAALIKEQVPEVTQISPEYIARGIRVKRGLKAAMPAITGVVLLSESHLTCHTFPERGYAAFNLYCCRPRSEWPWRERLAEALGATDIRVVRHDRGEATRPARDRLAC